MALASFNVGGVGGLPPIIPASDLGGVVRTQVAEPQPRTLIFTFPGISGSGSLDFGLDPGQIAWEWWLPAADYTALKAYEDELRGYRGAGRYALVSEIAGLNWQNVEFRRYEPDPVLDVIVGGSQILRHGRVYFEWMQP